MSSSETMSHIDEITATETQAQELIAEATTARDEKIAQAKSDVFAAEQALIQKSDEEVAKQTETLRADLEAKATAMRAEAQKEADAIRSVSDADVDQIVKVALDKLFA